MLPLVFALLAQFAKRRTGAVIAPAASCYCEILALPPSVKRDWMSCLSGDFVNDSWGLVDLIHR